MTNKYSCAMERIALTPQMEERILANILCKNEIPKKPRLNWVIYAGTYAACAVVALVLLLNPSVINRGSGSQQLNLTQPSANSEDIAVQPEVQQAIVPAPSVILGDTVTPPVDPRPKAFASSENSGKAVTQPSETPVPATGPSDNAGETGTQPEAFLTVAPAPSDSSDNAGIRSFANPIKSYAGINELKAAVPFELLVPEKLPAGYKIIDTSTISGELAQIIYSDGSNEITYRMAKKTEDISGDYNTYKDSETVKIADAEVTLKGIKPLINLAVWMKGDCSYSLAFSTGTDKAAVVSIMESIKKA